MKINITAVRMDLTPAIAEYVEKKILSLDKMVPPEDTSAIIHVEVGRETRHHQQGDIFFAKAQMHVAGTDIMGEEKAETLYAAIDMLRDELVKQLTTYKDRQITMRREGGRTIKNMLRRMWPFG
jgi:ribosomal subunit interface protein